MSVNGTGKESALSVSCQLHQLNQKIDFNASASTSTPPQGLKAPFCVPTDEFLRAKDDLLSEGRQSLSSLTAQVVRWCCGYVSVSCIRYSKRRNFRPKIRQNAFGGSARTRWGSLSATPDPLAAIGGAYFQGKGREGKGKGKEGDGKGKGGRAEEGRDGRGRTTCIAHYFRHCATSNTCCDLDLWSFDFQNVIKSSDIPCKLYRNCSSHSWDIVVLFGLEACVSFNQVISAVPWLRH